MGYGFTAADVAYLDSEPGRAALAEVGALELSDRTHLADLGRVRAAFSDRAPALVETTLLRRRAAAKLDDPARWLLTDEALQQATAGAVARHRAQRLAGRVVHDVTCSIGAELDALAAVCPVAVGSDLDPVRLAMARRNVPAAHLLRADALTPVTRASAGVVTLADPARRAGGRRRHDPAALVPPLPDLLAAHRGRDLVVKCAPGLDFDALGFTGEVEVTSLDGSVREACLYSPGLTEPAVTRRASVLCTGPDGAVTAQTYTDAEPGQVDPAAPGEYIVDPDGAVVRAGLVRQYAARHGLWQLDPQIAHLTGNRLPVGVRGHRILARTTVKDKALRAELARLGAGSVEILVRGVQTDPDALRRRMRLRGDRALSVVITRIGRSGVAFVCEPVRGADA